MKFCRNASHYFPPFPKI